jgi:hypothetical protein
MIEIVMFFSGWWYFSKLNKRIQDLEDEVMMLKRDESRVWHNQSSFGPFYYNDTERNKND